MQVQQQTVYGKAKKTLKFAEVNSICQDVGYMISTCAQLDESISFTPDVIDEQDTEKSSFLVLKMLQSVFVQEI